MTTNLLESMQQQLTPEMIQKVSLLLDETPAQTQKAVDGAILTLLAGLMHLSSSGDGPTQLVNLIKYRNYERLLDNLSGLLGEGNTAQTLIASGQDILRTLFTDKLSAVCTLLATASGVTHVSASSLLNLTAPLVVGMLGRVRTAQGLNAARLTKVLMGEKDYISKQAPAGLAGVFGLNNLADLGLEPAGAVTDMTPDLLIREVTEPVKEASMLKQWRWPVLAILAVGLIYLLMGRGVEVAHAPMVTAASAATPAVANVTLPSGIAPSLKEDPSIIWRRADKIEGIPNHYRPQP